MVIDYPIKDVRQVFAAQVAAMNTICKGCGAPMQKGGKFFDCCAAICFRDSHC